MEGVGRGAGRGRRGVQTGWPPDGGKGDGGSGEGGGWGRREVQTGLTLDDRHAPCSVHLAGN